MIKIIEMILVNVLTFTRIIGVFAIIPVFYKFGGLTAAIVAIACYLTDFLDGILARKLNVSTFLGSMLDSVADKLFTLANLILLLSISKIGFVPILCEIAIVIIQFIKFQKNINVQSSLAGKAKTWVMALTVVILYLVSDIEKITILSTDFINNVVAMNENVKYLIIYSPLIVFEVITLLSYLTFLEDYNPKEEVKLPNITEKVLPKTSLKNRWKNFCIIWLNNDFYMKYKDCANLKDIRKFVKQNK